MTEQFPFCYLIFNETKGFEMRDVMKDQVSKETSDKYSEICKDVADLIKRHSEHFDSVRELEYWLSQAVTSSCVKHRLLKRKGV